MRNVGCLRKIRSGIRRSYQYKETRLGSSGGLDADGRPVANLSGANGEFAGPLSPPEEREGV
jgi:hypothetical protein